MEWDEMVDGTEQMDGVGERIGIRQHHTERWDGWTGRTARWTSTLQFPMVFPAPRFRIVPFFLELRAVIDWMWTNTSLSLSSWTCLEDLYANIFIMKCHQESEKVGMQQVSCS